MTSPIEQFRDAIQSAGLIAPADIRPDGTLRRFSSSGKNGDDSGWYVMHGDGIPAGSFGDWRTGISQSWHADIGRALSPQEEAAHRARIEAIRREREAEDSRRHEAARRQAESIWEGAQLKANYTTPFQPPSIEQFIHLKKYYKSVNYGVKKM